MVATEKIKRYELKLCFSFGSTSMLNSGNFIFLFLGLICFGSMLRLLHQGNELNLCFSFGSDSSYIVVVVLFENGPFARYAAFQKSPLGILAS